jgi:aspartate-semialdehyde dehydrogenase
MRRVGFVGWRGMVGSVLMARMKAERDFDGSFEPVYFSTSQVGRAGPDGNALLDASDIVALGRLDIVVTCQGGDYTNAVYPRLRQAGWTGYWLDAASALRMKDHAIIVLDPVNMNVIKKGLRAGVKDYIGGNCTVSLLLMGLTGLFREKLVDSVITMTYQAASGAGAKNMQELVAQIAHLAQATSAVRGDAAATALDLDRVVTAELRSGRVPAENFGAPLVASLIPWIDKAMENGQTREEWKGGAEANKILGTKKAIPVDGICVRVGAMRCHSQGVAIKLKREVPIKDIESLIAGAHEWAKVVPNTREATLRELSPAAVSGTLVVPVGRLHPMSLGPKWVTCFTVGDQLLWGAAEPIRRILRIVLKQAKKK